MGMRNASESSSMTSSNLGTVTGNIEFANVQSKKISIAERKKEGVAKEQVTYKLIDFGSAVGIHEDETAGVHDHENMMTATELEFAGYRLLHAHQVWLMQNELIFLLLTAELLHMHLLRISSMPRMYRLALMFGHLLLLYFIWSQESFHLLSKPLLPCR